jgi:protein-tyrosine-phosphatase
MAAAFFNHIARNGIAAISAGTNPAEHVNPLVIEVMGEVGIDISQQKPRALTLEMMEKADRAITMGCGVEETCPASFIPTENWELDDPEGKPLDEVRRIRDDIKARVETLVTNLDLTKV